MISKPTFIAIGALAGLAAAPAAFGFAEIARGTLTADARFSGEYDSNIFANSSETGDYSFIFMPSLSYTRNVGRISTAIQVGIRTISFTDTSGQNSIDPSVNAVFTYDGAEKGSVSQSLSYQRSTDANDTLNTRAESNEYRAATRVDYYYSEKTGLRFNAGYRLSDYVSAGYNDVSSYNVGGGVLYRYSPKLIASATYDFSPEKATSLGVAPTSDPSSKNHRIQLGLEGELAPKVTGNVGVGVVHREFDIGGSDDAFLLTTAVSWAAAEKTAFTLSASNNFDTTPGAESAKNFNVNLAVRQTLTEKIAVGANIGYIHSLLQQEPGPVERTDNGYLAGLNSSYRFTDNVSLSATLSYRYNDSTLALAQYERFVANLSLNLSF